MIQTVLSAFKVLVSGNNNNEKFQYMEINALIPKIKKLGLRDFFIGITSLLPVLVKHVCLLVLNIRKRMYVLILGTYYECMHMCFIATLNCARCK